MELQGKIVAYVGGFGGIGMAVCKQFICQNISNLIILDYQQNEEALKELQCQNKNVNVQFVQFDVTKGLQNARYVLGTVYKKNQFDILVNGAGIADESRIEDMLAINLAGLIYTTTAAIELWDKRSNGKGGLIISIASILGLRHILEMPIYCATKSGVIQFTRSIAAQEAITGVKGIAVCPGVVTTPLLGQLHPYLDVTDTQVFTKRLVNANPQTPAEFAEGFMKMMKTAKSGSVWTIIEGQANEVNMPNILEKFEGLEFVPRTIFGKEQIDKIGALARSVSAYQAKNMTLGSAQVSSSKGNNFFSENMYIMLCRILVSETNMEASNLIQKPISHCNPSVQLPNIIHLQHPAF